jgi:RNA-directed DNA polymerase
VALEPPAALLGWLKNDVPAGRGLAVAWLKKINPQVQGWINYYGAFYRSELRFLAWRINEHLVRWAMHKFKRFRGKYAKAMAWLQKVYQYKPGLFAHWHLIAFT